MSCLEATSKPDSLLCLEVSKMGSRDTSGDAALGEEDSVLSSSVAREARPVSLLDSGLSSSMGLNAGEGSKGGVVANNDLLLSSDHILSSRDSGDLKETTGLVTERVVDALGKGETSREGRALGAGRCSGGKGKDKEGRHLSVLIARKLSQSLRDSTASPELSH